MSFVTFYLTLFPPLSLSLPSSMLALKTNSLVTIGGGISGFSSVQFSSVLSLSRVRLFVTPWIAARQASLSITNSRSSLKVTSIESVMPSSHLILCHPLLLLPPIPPSIRVFSSESTLGMRWPKYWSFSFSIIPSKEIPGLDRAPQKVPSSQHCHYLTDPAALQESPMPWANFYVIWIRGHLVRKAFQSQGVCQKWSASMA